MRPRCDFFCYCRGSKVMEILVMSHSYHNKTAINLSSHTLADQPVEKSHCAWTMLSTCFYQPWFFQIHLWWWHSTSDPQACVVLVLYPNNSMIVLSLHLKSFLPKEWIHHHIAPFTSSETSPLSSIIVPFLYFAALPRHWNACTMTKYAILLLNIISNS